MDQIQNNILKKALSNKLGHFFIVNPPGRAKKPKEALMKWASEVISAYFQQNNCATQELRNNEDILIIDDEMAAKKFYEKTFVDQIGQFLSHKPIRADRKFIIIEDLTKMSTIHSNKLLKIFEEPPVNASIFLLNPSLAKPLATISSRAVSLRVKVPVESGSKDLDKWIKKLEKKNLHQFCDYFKTRKEDEAQLASALLDKHTYDMEQELFKSLQKKTKKYLDFHREDSLYNHNSYARLTLLREIFLDLSV